MRKVGTFLNSFEGILFDEVEMFIKRQIPIEEKEGMRRMVKLSMEIFQFFVTQRGDFNGVST